MKMIVFVLKNEMHKVLWDLEIKMDHPEDMTLSQKEEPPPTRMQSKIKGIQKKLQNMKVTVI